MIEERYPDYEKGMPKNRMPCKYSMICKFRSIELPCDSDSLRYTCEHANDIDRNEQGHLK